MNTEILLSRLPYRLPCVRCDQLRRLRADDLCHQCGRASDASIEADRLAAERRMSKIALERALGLEVAVA